MDSERISRYAMRSASPDAHSDPRPIARDSWSSEPRHGEFFTRVRDNDLIDLRRGQRLAMKVAGSVGSRQCQSSRRSAQQQPHARTPISPMHAPIALMVGFFADTAILERWPASCDGVNGHQALRNLGNLVLEQAQEPGSRCERNHNRDAGPAARLPTG